MVAVLLPAGASAEVQWSYRKQDGLPYLVGFSGEHEGDSEFWALCRNGGAIEIGVGADTNVGNGEGEKVTLTLASAGRSAALSGVSRKSENWEMTTGTELRATIAKSDPVFAVLGTGQPISVSGSVAKPLQWKVRGLKSKLAAFLVACK